MASERNVATKSSSASVVSSKKGSDRKPAASVVSSKRGSDRKSAVNRNVYENVGAESPSQNIGIRLQTKKAAVNRNVYENVGAESPSQKIDIRLKTKKAAINRNVYEAIEVEAGGPAKSTRSVVADAVSTRGNQDLSSRSTTTTTTTRSRIVRRDQVEKDKLFAKLTRGVVIGCSALLTAVVLCALIAAVVWLVWLREPEEPPEPTYGTTTNATYGRELCLKGYKTEMGDVKNNPSWMECVLVKPPRKTNRSCHTVSCTRKTHLLSNDYGNYSPRALDFYPDARIKYWNYTDLNDPKIYKYSLPVFCVHGTGGHSAHLHVCQYGKCNFHYAGNLTLLYGVEHFRSSWTDNCDEPNSCWALDQAQRQFMRETNTTALTFSRNACKSSTNYHDCPINPLVGAVVWLQHLRCEVHNSDQIGEYCKGMPMELWECRWCRGRRNNVTSSDISRYIINAFCPEGSTGKLFDECSVICGSNTNMIVPLPNGIPCQDKGTTARAYCALGICMSVKEDHQHEYWDLSTIDDVETCRRKRNATRPKKPRFEVIPV